MLATLVRLLVCTLSCTQAVAALITNVKYGGKRVSPVHHTSSQLNHVTGTSGHHKIDEEDLPALSDDSDDSVDDLEVQLTKEVDAAAARTNSNHHAVTKKTVHHVEADEDVDEDEGIHHTIKKKAVHHIEADEDADEDEGIHHTHTIKKKTVHHVEADDDADEDEVIHHTIKKKAVHHAVAHDGEGIVHALKKFTHHAKVDEDEGDASQKMLAHEAFKRSQAAKAQMSQKKVAGSEKSASYFKKMQAMEDKWNKKKGQKIAVTAGMAAGTYVKPVQEEKQQPQDGIGDFFKKLGYKMP